MHELDISAEPLFGPMIRSSETTPSGKLWRWHEWRQFIAAT